MTLRPRWSPHLRLLPVLVLVSGLSLVVRVGEVMTGARTLPGAAMAEEKASASKAEPEKPTEKKAEVPEKGGEKATDQPAEKSTKKTDPVKPEPGKDTAPSAKEAKSEGGKAWPDAADSDPAYVDVQTELFKDLSRRSAELDIREKQMTTREAVLKATEAELEQKYQELTELRKQLEEFLHKQSEEEEARTRSLVRIYEGMKPEDAARIFNTLDLTVLLDVMSRMSERKSGPILANMDPDRARIVTISLAQQKKLPDLPDLDPALGGGQ